MKRRNNRTLLRIKIATRWQGVHANVPQTMLMLFQNLWCKRCDPARDAVYNTTLQDRRQAAIRWCYVYSGTLSDLNNRSYIFRAIIDDIHFIDHQLV